MDGGYRQLERKPSLSWCKPVKNGHSLNSAAIESNMTIFRVILVFIHWCIALRDTFLAYFCRLTQLGQRLGKQPVCMYTIRSDAMRLRRLPVHLSLVVVEDDVNVVDIARIVAWAVAAGISYVTIYDHKGCCKKEEEDFLRKLKEQEERLRKCRRHSACMPLSSGVHDCPPDGDSHALNGGVAKQNACIQVVGPDDGRQELVNLAKQLGRQMTKRAINSSDITVPFVDAIIREKYSFPDPDLVMKFGAVNSLLGFLPWQTRLTEIFSLPTHHHLDFSSFFAALDEFGNTQQRCGK